MTVCEAKICSNCSKVVDHHGENNFMIADKDFSDTIGKYIDWQTHTASSYTIMMRKAAKIIDHKYKSKCDFDDLKA